MDVLAMSPKNTTQKVAPIEGCAKFAVDDTPTVLHGLKIQKYKKKGNNEDTDTKEDKPEEVKCASTNTGSDVISMCIVPVQFASTSTSKKVHNYALLNSCSQVHSYWTNWQMTLEFLEERPHLQTKH